MTREEFIEKNKHLDMPKDSLNNISDDVLTEFIFIYGDWEDIKMLCKIIGFDKLKKAYKNTKGERGNYSPELYNFLKLIVKKYAP